MEVVNEVVCLGRGVGGEVCWAVKFSCFVGWYGRSRVWKLHSSKCYTFNIAYNNLIEVEENIYPANNHILLLKEVPIKIYIFAWCLLLNCDPTKDNMLSRRIIALNDQNYSTNYVLNEDKEQLFFKCDFYRRTWPLISIIVYIGEYML